MRVKDLIYYLKLLEAPQFFALFERHLTSEIKLIRTKPVPRYVRELWVHESRRALRYALFLRYYAIFENQLKLQCDRFAEDDEILLRLSDISGDNLLNKVDKYIEKVARRPPLHEHRLWLDLLAYAWLRNRIMHDDGKVSDLKSVPQFVSRLLRRRTVGLSISADGVIRLNRPFCRRFVGCMARILYYVYGSLSSNGAKTE